MNLRVLVDMNLPPNWAGFLTQHGIEASHWNQIGPADAEDELLVEWAINHSAAILTLDLDFARIVALSKLPLPSVVLLRLQETIPDALGPYLLVVLQKYETQLLTGSILSVHEHVTRVRSLPLIP